ncbi:MAG: tRNA-queuosine alpha-mannosyltransferase domain-containing protein [Anaerolineae bacterium]
MDSEPPLNGPPSRLRIWLVEPYATGSHEAWVEGYRAHARHEVVPLTLPGRFWKWRMHGGAVTLARRALALGETPDVILATDMLDLTTFLALTRQRCHHVPVALYFHENQLTYPLPPGQKRDLHYGFIHFTSALTAQRLFFNSAYHLETFFEELPRLLKHFPDYHELHEVERLRARSEVLPLGLDLKRLDAYRPATRWNGRHLLLWNHRWEYDKDPETFFRAVYALVDEGLDFGLIVLGESFRQKPQEFLEARERLGDRIVQFGYAPSLADYARFLWQADLVVSTALHDFFGAATVEAVYCECFPILPRRLAYPEWIPQAWHDEVFYSSFEDLLALLRRRILEIEATRRLSLREAVAHLDWDQMAPRYDQALEGLARHRGTEATV